jgi:hypothetical protein
MAPPVVDEEEPAEPEEAEQPEENLNESAQNRWQLIAGIKDV